MGNISIRKLNDNVLKALRTRASASGVSMEEEVRRILSKAVEPEETVGEMMERIFSPSWEINEPFEVPQDDFAEPEALFGNK